LVTTDKLVSVLFNSINTEQSVKTTRYLLDRAQYPERVEVIINFDVEDYEYHTLKDMFKEFDNVKIVHTPKGYGYCDGLRFNHESFDVSCGEFIMIFNDKVEEITANWDNLIAQYSGKLLFLTINEISDVDGTRQEWHELFDFPLVHRKWIEITGRVVYTMSPASDLYPIVKYFPEIVRPSGIDLIHFPGHTASTETDGMCFLIENEDYPWNKKVLHDGVPIYHYEALQKIDIPRVKRFLELNPEYKV